MDFEAKPKCPMCKKTKHVVVHGPHNYTCLNCKMDFDGIDDGDIGRGRPDRNAERCEEYELRRQHNHKLNRQSIPGSVVRVVGDVARRGTK